jgi:long-chain acyl-CoA synthetase
MLLSRAAAEHPQSCAIIFERGELSYADVELASQRAARYLQQEGVGRGSRVGLQLPNCPAFVALYFGLLRLGATVVPQSPRSTTAELDQNMTDAGVELVLIHSVPGDSTPALAGDIRVVTVSDDGLELFGGHAPLREVNEVPGDQTAVILYTSGTTGRAKGAELTHSNLGRNALSAIDVYSLGHGDVILGVLPLYHSYGQTCTLNATVAVGARVVLIKRYEMNAVAEAIDGYAVTVFLGVPTMFSDIAHCPDSVASLKSLRMCGAGGAPLPPEVRRSFEERSGATLFETYGLSETSPIASINRRGTDRRAGTIGWPIDGTEMKIAGRSGEALPPGEVGEIAIRGHNVMKGYWRNPEATSSAIDTDGWFLSGDLGTVDSDGCFSVVGRSKDVIIRGGHNIYPREIEDLLHTHPAVRMAAVVGIADDRLGEEIGAAIVLEHDADASVEDVHAWADRSLSSTKRPRRVWAVDALPLGPTGKVLKRLIVPPPPPTGDTTAGDQGVS